MTPPCVRSDYGRQVSRLPCPTKDKKDPAVRRKVIDGLLVRAPWLKFEGTDAELLSASDDCLDALLCALVAKACHQRRTIPPIDPVLAGVEGWIHLPEAPGVLEELT